MVLFHNHLYKTVSSINSQCVLINVHDDIYNGTIEIKDCLVLNHGVVFMEIIKVNDTQLHLAEQAKALFFPSNRGDGINASFFKDDRNIMLVAVEERNVVGMVYGYMLDRFDKNDCQLFLYSIDVVQEHRGKGIGKALVEAFLQPLQNGLCNEAFVFTHERNQQAMQLYATTGGTRIVSDEGNDVLFEWHSDDFDVRK